MPLQAPEGSALVSDWTEPSEGLQGVFHETMSGQQSGRKAPPAQDPEQHVEGKVIAEQVLVKLCDQSGETKSRLKKTRVSVCSRIERKKIFCQYDLNV